MPSIYIMLYAIYAMLMPLNKELFSIYCKLSANMCTYFLKKAKICIKYFTTPSI